MGKNVDEEVYKIYKLLYGKKYVKNRIKSLQNIFENDDPKKADLIKRDNLQDFYNTLGSIDEPLFQQKYGNMQYQKSIEAVQIGLILLGYQLPRFGVDGLYGPETAQAVNKFKQDNKINDSGVLNEATFIAPIPNLRVTSEFGKQRQGYQHHGVDLGTPSGTQIKSPAEGTVIAAEFADNNCGGKIQIQHANNFISKFCHCKQIDVQINDKVKQGQVVGLSGGGPGDKGAGRSTGAHLHFELKKDGSLVDPLDYIGAEVGTYDFNKTQAQTTTKSSITTEMVDKMIEMLKSKNITVQDIQKYVDTPVYTGGSVEFTDVDLKTDDGFRTYASIADAYIKTRSSNHLSINGNMIATGAKMAFDRYAKYIPPELSLSQLALEGCFTDNPKAIPIVTKNPYNVGNNGITGDRKYYNNVQDGINAYFELIARNYITKGKTASELVNNFVNKNNMRYAGEGDYEKQLKIIVPKVNAIAKQITQKNTQ